MAENKQAELNVLQKRHISKAQSILEGRITIPQGDLKKVLKTSVHSFISSCEILDKQANITGKTKFSVVYINESGEFKSAELLADFSEKIVDDSLLSGQKGFCKAEVVDSDISSISESEIKIASVTDINLFAIDELKNSYVAECADNFICLKNCQKFSSINSFCKNSFETNFDIDVKNKICEVLSSDFCVTVKKVVVEGEQAKIDGEIEANIIYTTVDGEIVLKTLCETVSFEESITCCKLSENGSFETIVSVANCKVDSKNSELSVRLNINVMLLETTQTQIYSISDAFSSCNDVELTYENSTFDYLVKTENVHEKISAVAEVNKEDFILNKIIGSSAKNLLISNVFASEDFVTVEGLANITTFCEDGKEGTDEKFISSIDVEIPFSIKTYVAGVSDESKIDVDACIGDVNVKHKRTNEIDVSTLLKINIYLYGNENIVLVKNVALGEEKQTNNSSISFYITKKKDTPFEICKRFSMPIETIVAYNKTIEELLIQEVEIPEGTQIVVYRQKSVNF